MRLCFDPTDLETTFSQILPFADKGLYASDPNLD